MPETEQDGWERERYRLVVENLRDYAVFTTDTDGTIDTWNPGAEQTLGYGEAEIIGQNIALLFTPEDRAAGRPQRELGSAVAAGRADDTRWHVRADGRRIWVEGVTLALYERGAGPDASAGAGVLRGFAKIMRDETQELEQQQALRRAHDELERRVAERTEALRRSEERFQKAFNLSPAPTVIVRLEDKRYLNVNDSFLLLTGYARDEVVGQTLAQVDLYVDAPGRERTLEGLRRGVPVPLREMDIRGKAGDVKNVMVASEVIDVEGKTCQLDIFIDISERKRSEAQLMRALDEVMSDTSWFSRTVVERLAQLRSEPVDQTGLGELTARERQVLTYVARGANNEAIGAALGLATQTVRNYLSSIYEKLGLHTRAEVVVWARERGLG